MISLTSLKLKKLCAEKKKNVKRTKRQATNWKKIFAKNTSDKGLLSKIYKELLKFNYRKQKAQFKNEPRGTSQAVQWLRLCASNAGGEDSIPGQGTKIPHAMWCSKKQ